MQILVVHFNIRYIRGRSCLSCRERCSFLKKQGIILSLYYEDGMCLIYYYIFGEQNAMVEDNRFRKSPPNVNKFKASIIEAEDNSSNSK